MPNTQLDVIDHGDDPLYVWQLYKRVSAFKGDLLTSLGGKLAFGMVKGAWGIYSGLSRHAQVAAS